MQALLDEFDVLGDWLVHPINLLKDCLHHRTLHLCKCSNFHHGLFALSLGAWRDAVYHLISCKVFLHRDLLLNLFRVKALEAIWLDRKVLIEVFQVPDEVVDCLALLLSEGERHLKDVAVHSLLLC